MKNFPRLTLLMSIFISAIALASCSLIGKSSSSDNDTCTLTFKFVFPNGFYYTDTKNFVKNNQIPESDFPTTPTSEGYTFLGWYDGDKKIEPGFTLYRNMTLVTKWEKILDSFIISFDSNGGSNISSTAVKEGHSITADQLETPTKTGYNFEGWYLEETKINSGYKPTSDITLSAKWKAITYTIQFNANGGRGTAPESISATYGESVTLPKNTFSAPYNTNRKGWMSSSEYTEDTEYYNDGAKVENLASTQDAVVTLYARYVKLVTVTFISEYGTIEKPSVQVETGTYTYEFAQPTAPGLIFDGWYNGDKYVSIITENITLTARWTALEWTLNFHMNKPSGVSIEAIDKSLMMTAYPYDYYYQQTFTGGTDTHFLPVNFESVTHKFIGWNTKANGLGTMYPDLHEFAWEDELTQNDRYHSPDLYAQWQIKDLTFNVTLPLDSDSSNDIALSYKEETLSLYATLKNIKGEFTIFVDGKEEPSVKLTTDVNNLGTRICSLNLRTIFNTLGITSGAHSITVYGSTSEHKYSQTAFIYFK